MVWYGREDQVKSIELRNRTSMSSTYHGMLNLREPDKLRTTHLHDGVTAVVFIDFEGELL